MRKFLVRHSDYLWWSSSILSAAPEAVPPSHVFPALATRSVDDVRVFGRTNLAAAGAKILCHDLYDFSRDLLPEEQEHRLTIVPDGGAIEWPECENPPTGTLPEAATFLDANSRSYGRWLVEVLARIALFCEQGQFRGVPILIDPPPNPHCLEAVRLLVGNASQVRIVRPDECLQVGRLIVPSPTSYVPFAPRDAALPAERTGMFSPHAMALLRQQVLKRKPSGVRPHKIYLRRRSKHRVLENRRDIESWLTGQGFAIIEPEQYSIPEQAAFFADADLIVAPTGSAVANMIFSAPASRMLILIGRHPDMPYWHWQGLAGACRKQIEYVRGAISAGQSDRGIHADFEVKLDDLADAIKAVS